VTVNKTLGSSSTRRILAFDISIRPGNTSRRLRFGGPGGEAAWADQWVRCEKQLFLLEMGKK
jgi:hypothetical protein